MSLLNEPLGTTLRGYQRASAPERSAFGMLTGFASTVAISRAINYVLERNRLAPRTRSRLRRAVKLPRRQQSRVHHFVPGIGIAFTVAALAIAARSDGREAWLAPAFGVGAGLTLDEFALLFDLNNAYWASEQSALVAAGGAGLSAFALATRFHIQGGRKDVEAPESHAGQMSVVADPGTRQVSSI